MQSNRMTIGSKTLKRTNSWLVYLARNIECGMSTILRKYRTRFFPFLQVTIVKRKKQYTLLTKRRRITFNEIKLADSSPNLTKFTTARWMVDKPAITLSNANARDLTISAVFENNLISAALLRTTDGIWLKRLKEAILKKNIRNFCVTMRHPNYDWPRALFRDTIADAHVFDVDIFSCVYPCRSKTKAF